MQNLTINERQRDRQTDRHRYRQIERERETAYKKINHRNAITKHPKTQSETINRTSRVCRLYFRYIYTIKKFVPVSVALSVYVCVCVYVRLTSVTDKSKRQHFGLFFQPFFDQKPKAGWGAVRTCIELTLKRFGYWIVLLLLLLFVGVLCLLFFLYFYFIDIGRYFFFSTEPNRPNLPLSTCLACLPFISCNWRFNLPTSSTAYRIYMYIEKKYLNMHSRSI